MKNRCLTLLLLLLTALLPVSRAADPASLPVVFGVVGIEQTEDDTLFVTRLARLSPAEKAGIRPTDELVSVAGQPVPTRPALMQALAEHRAGDKVPVVLLRDGREVHLTVTLEARREVMQAKPRPVAPISGEKLNLIIELQRSMARELARKQPQLGRLFDMSAQIRTLSGGLADAGTTTLRYRDAQGLITLTATPDTLELQTDGHRYLLSAPEVTNPLPEALRERLQHIMP